jgi:hypothetical protein
MRGERNKPSVCFCLSPLSQTYRIHLSSIAILYYNKRIFILDILPKLLIVPFCNHFEVNIDHHRAIGHLRTSFPLVSPG